MKNTEKKLAQPEALVQFGKSARSDRKKCAQPGLTADQETAPVPTDPKIIQSAATKVLREGVFHRDEGSDEQIAKSSDRNTRDRRR